MGAESLYADGELDLCTNHWEACTPFTKHNPVQTHAGHLVLVV